MRLFIIRHAEPDYPNNTITPAGHREAAALAERFERIGLDHIYMSPLGRAMHTAKHTADRLGVAPIIEPWTAEVSDCLVTLPPWGKMCVWDTPGEIIRAQAPYVTHDDWHTREPFHEPLFKENFDRIRDESDAFLARHGYVRDGGRYRIEQGHRERIAVFCHGGFALWWMAHLLELPLPLVFAGFQIAPSSVTTILFDERSKQWSTPRCIGFADVSHLYAAGLPVSRMGVVANHE